MISWSRVARRIRVPLGFAFAVLYLWLAHPTISSIATGVLITIPGLLLRGLASGHVQKNEQLATSGPYAYTRNPLYLGSLIIAAGFCVASRSWWIALAAVVFFLAIYVPVIRDEENYLRGKFPEFEKYSQTVPRLLPTLRARTDSSGSFSWELYQKHREYNAVLGSLGVWAALVIKLLWMSN
jgi:protein-S-isoprenylcysteine O-methyltransferase Ste14